MTFNYKGALVRENLTSDNFVWVSDEFIAMHGWAVKIFVWLCGLIVFKCDDNWPMANVQGGDNTYRVMINVVLH